MKKIVISVALAGVAAHASADLFGALKAISNVQNAQQALQIQQMQANGLLQRGNAPTIAAPVVLQAVSEEAVAEKIKALGAPLAGASISGARDGFSVNGRRHIDAEGTIDGYAYDVMSGDITYAINTSYTTRTYKYLPAGSDKEPLVIGVSQRSMAGWQFNSLSGKSLSGDAVTLTPKGVLVVRDSAAFRYEPGTGTISVAVPDGWSVAPMQRGNLASGYLMLEKIEEESMLQLNKVMSLGATVGLNKKEDYALLEIKTGKLTLLNIQLDGKNQTSLSNCRRKNSMVNVCENATSYESLYSDVGRNMGHYYWKANWMNTPGGPIMVSMENGVQDIFITDLKTGKKTLAFSRTLGISDFDVYQSPDGNVRINAKWMFQDHVIENAVKFLQENPDITLAQAK